jgi:DNA-binding NtrC family response regulator
MQRALIVDDLAADRELVGRELAAAGFALSFAADGREALDRLETERPDLIVTDHRVPRVDAIALLRRVRAVSDVPVVILTTSGSIPDCERAMRSGADRFLQFRRDLGRLGAVARAVVESHETRRVAAAEVTAEEARALGQRELRSLLQRLVVECRGNIAEIARRMDRDRSTIRYHLRRMGLLGRARDPQSAMRRGPS